MKQRIAVVLTMTFAVAAVLWIGGRPAAAQGGAALTGTVRSPQESAMEGVVVTARRGGSPISVSVVTDARGKFMFPRSHVQAGRYAVTMRATGYELTVPGTVEVGASRAATLDLNVVPTADLSKQLTSREWALSLPEKTDMLDKT